MYSMGTTLMDQMRTSNHPMAPLVHSLADASLNVPPAGYNTARPVVDVVAASKNIFLSLSVRVRQVPSIGVRVRMVKR